MRSEPIRLGWRRAVPLLMAVGVMAAGVVLGGGPSRAEETKAAEKKSADEMHAELLDAEAYPSASKCMACHEDIYKEWSSRSETHV